MRLEGQRGMTVLEILIACGLLVVLGVVMTNLIRSGLGAHTKGTEIRDAQSGARNVLSILVAELRSAVVPPLSDPSVSTPVFWPGAWGADSEFAYDGELQQRVTLTAEEGSEVDSATNRVLYVRSVDDETDPGDGPLAQFALVELIIPDEAPNTLERRVYPLATNDGILKRKSAKGADGTTSNRWMVDNAALHAGSMSDREVLFDVGSTARLAFEVSHRSFEPVSDPGRTRFPELFDPGVFKIDVVVAVRPSESDAVLMPWPVKEQWTTHAQEKTELRIPGVRHN